MTTGARPPIIIIGMHRSGTSMLTRTLQGLGFFMGRGTTRNEECRWTNRLNYWIFRQASATWERPEGVDTLLSTPDLVEPIADYLTGVVDGPASVGYLGLLRYSKFRSMQRIADPWGWKDPRNTFTLPIWLDIFPHARVLHITRHGVDVAESLRVRHMEASRRAVDRFRRRRTLYVNNPLAPKSGGFAHSSRVRDLAGGLALWEAYTARAQAHVRTLGDRALELRYEDLLADPLPNLRRILNFCGLDVENERVKREAQKFDPTRAYAYRRQLVLRQAAVRYCEQLSCFGY